MKKTLLALSLAVLAAACADAPTEPARAVEPGPVSASTSGAFSVTLALQGMPDMPRANWYFGAELQNASSTNVNDYYFTWTSGLNVLKEGYGAHTYTVADGTIGPDIDLQVEVTGPDGFAWDYIQIWTGPWSTAGTLDQFSCFGKGC